MRQKLNLKWIKGLNGRSKNARLFKILLKHVELLINWDEGGKFYLKIP